MYYTWSVTTAYFPKAQWNKVHYTRCWSAEQKNLSYKGDVSCAVLQYGLLLQSREAISPNVGWNFDLSQPLFWIFCSESSLLVFLRCSLLLRGFAGGSYHCFLPQNSLGDGFLDWTSLTLCEVTKIPLSLLPVYLNYLSFLPLPHKTSELSPSQSAFKWSNCWNTILVQWSWIKILAPHASNDRHKLLSVDGEESSF